MIFQILAKNDDFSTCSQNWWFFKFMKKKKTIFFYLVKIDDFSKIVHFVQIEKNIFYGSWCCLSVMPVSWHWHDTGVVSVLPTLSQHWTLYIYLVFEIKVKYWGKNTRRLSCHGSYQKKINNQFSAINSYQFGYTSAL